MTPRPLVLAIAVALTGAPSSQGESPIAVRKAIAEEMRAHLASVRQVTADPISTGGVLVTNAAGAVVWAAAPVDTPTPGLAFMSGAMFWGSSAGANTPGGAKGALGVSDDNAGVIEVSSSSNVAVVQIHGNYGLRTVAGDVAEVFPSEAPAEPGAVMSIDSGRAGALIPAREPYDRRVVGVVSGARDYAPGVTLRGLAEIRGVTLTLTGTVYCLASDVNGPIRPGDMLTSSAIPGYAMRATDLDKARGAILGKALEGLPSGRGHVLMVATLQ